MDGVPFGRYRLTDLLGRGGMGEVWRAFDTVTERVVALKVLSVQFADDSGFQQRFRREARSAAVLDEPHVVPIYDFGEIEGRLFVTMRLINGQDLHTLLAGGPLDPARAVKIVDQVASALDAAHRTGLIHRDVKPSNILVAEDDFAYLIDFGIARTVGQTSLTNTGQVIGTWAYLAPERVTSDHTDHRADIYALTCVLFECLTGQQPFPGDSLEKQLGGHIALPPPRPSALRPGIPSAFDEVIATGMAKNPDQRYATTRDFGTAARAALHSYAAHPESDQMLGSPATVSADELPRGSGPQGQAVVGETAASWARRVLALTADVLIPLGVIATVALVAAGTAKGTWLWWLCVCTGVAVFLFIPINRLVVVAKTGWSLGRGLASITVVSANQPPRLPQLLARDAAHLLDTAPLLIGWMWPLIDSRRRTFADIATGTQVRRVESRPRTLPRLTALVLTAFLTLGLIMTGLNYELVYRQQQVIEAARDQIRIAGPNIIQQVLSYDSRTLDADFARAQSLVTDSYRTKLADQQELVKKKNAGTDAGAFSNSCWVTNNSVLSAAADTAEMLMFLQGRRSKNGDEQFITASAQVRFERSGGGQWRMADLIVLTAPGATEK